MSDNHSSPLFLIPYPFPAEAFKDPRAVRRLTLIQNSPSQENLQDRVMEKFSLTSTFPPPFLVKDVPDPFPFFFGLQTL